MIHLGILGYPLSHSLSPVFQSVFLEACGLSGTYQRYEVPPEALHFWLGAHPPLRGLNVTIPHKVTVMAYCDQVSSVAQRIGAVNTLCFEPDGSIIGHNTDGVGFMAPLQTRSFTNRHVLILGTGGASRAVAVSLADAGVSVLTFVSRHPEQGQAKLADLMAHCPNVTWRFVDAATKADLGRVDLVVNTTPLGMSPNVEASPLLVADLAALPRTAGVYDLVYNPLETQLLKDAKAQGLWTQDGLAMLIAQGAESFRLWTGCVVSETTLKDAKDRLLSRLQASL